MVSADAFAKKIDGAPNKKYIYEVVLPDSKVSKVSIKFFEREIETTPESILINDKNEPLSGYIFVSKYSFFVPKFSIGVAYSDYSYPVYGTTTDAAGETIVGQPSNDKPPMIIASYLNLMMDINTNNIFPMIQFGIGTGKNTPSILLGAGIAFYTNNSFSLGISGGFTNTFIRELTSLKAGVSKVKGTEDIEKDLRYVPGGFKGYVGIQSNFKFK